MCLIVAKPSGVKMPTDADLWAMWNANPGGAGFMYLTKDHIVRIEKGFMRFIDLMTALDDIKDKTDTDIVIHFRRMKNRNPAFTHPFPLDRPDDILALTCDARMGVAQNGIIKSEPQTFGLSRNMAFTTRVLSPMWNTNHCFLDYATTRDLLGFTTNCKMAFLDDSGFLIFVGEFYRVDGVFYSNNKFDAPNLTTWADADKIEPMKKGAVMK